MIGRNHFGFPKARKLLFKYFIIFVLKNGHKHDQFVNKTTRGCVGDLAKWLGVVASLAQKTTIMLLFSSMINVAVRGHEEICVDFQPKIDLACAEVQTNDSLWRAHSLECKSVLIGMISRESCDSGVCKFDEWLLYIGLAKLFDLALNLAALIIAAVDYGRYIYGSELQLLRSNFYRTLGFIKLGLILMSAIVCILILYLDGQFDPVVDELIDNMDCLSTESTSVFVVADGITAGIYGQMMMSLLFLVIQDLVDKWYKANDGKRYMRLLGHIETRDDFLCRIAEWQFGHLFFYLMLAFFGLVGSGTSLYYWGNSIEVARTLHESTTSQELGLWCFYCPGDEPIVQLGAHVAVKYIGWFLVILNAMALLSILVLALRALCCHRCRR